MQNGCMTTHSILCLMIVKRSTLDMFSGPRDPIPLCHFGLKEVKAKVDLMEDQYDRPMVFDEARVPLTGCGAGVRRLGAGCCHV